MEFWQGLLVLSVVHWLAAAAPGPDFALVTQQTLAHGRKQGIACSAGITLGLTVHIAYSILGLAALIASSTQLLWWIKVLGGLYLIYLGIRGLLASSKSRSMADRVAGDVSVSAELADSDISLGDLRKSFTRGVLCNVLNPKAPIYFVALFTVVLSPELPLYQLLAYAVVMMVIQFIWFSTLVVLLSSAPVSRRLSNSAHWIERVLGAAMIGLGVKVLGPAYAS